MIPGLLLVLAGAGCGALGAPSSASFASVTISRRSVPEIRDATMAVFREAGYGVYASTTGELVFTQEGSRANTLARDGLMGAQAGAVTLVRVRVDIVELAAGSHRLQGQAYMVSGAGDAFFEDEHRLANFRSRPYQQLLDKVAQRLAQPPLPSASNQPSSVAP